MKKPAIFIVEDERIVAEDIGETLKKLGYLISGIAVSGEAALENIRETLPDLVLMDIHLAGDMDGIEAAGQIRTLFDIPVIYLTAYADNELIERAKVTEPYGYVLKPFNDREVHSVIEMALYKHSINEKIRERDSTIDALINTTHDAMLLLDNDGNILAANEPMAQRLNRKALDLVNTPFNDLLSNGSISLRLAEEERRVRAGTPAHFVEELKGRWFENNLHPVFDAKGSVAKVAIYCHDITAMKDAERDLAQVNAQILQEKEELLKFTAAVDGMDDSVIITDHTGTISYLNRAGEKMLGSSLANAQGQHISQFKAPESKFMLEKETFIMDSKGVWTGNLIIKNKHGLKIRTSLKSSPVIKDNRIISRVFVLREQV
ncbi:MAG: response regulator [Methanoregula sp.]|nr:MAG: response regulator [Methanoregula sp.]